jgi:hypothetical protein
VALGAPVALLVAFGGTSLAKPTVHATASAVGLAKAANRHASAALKRANLALKTARSSSGPSGAAGPAGPAGSAGPAGPAGSAGPIGRQGQQGPKGDTGPQGTTGTTGATGPPGISGYEVVLEPGIMKVGDRAKSFTVQCSRPAIFGCVGISAQSTCITCPGR